MKNIKINDKIIPHEDDDFIELQHDSIAVNKDQLALVIKYMKKELNLSFQVLNQLCNMHQHWSCSL